MQIVCNTRNEIFLAASSLSLDISKIVVFNGVVQNLETKKHKN